MADLLDTVQKIINSPPGQIAAGGVLAGIVWKFFERVEAVLTDQTKFEIAVWLVGVKPFGPKIQPWPDTFAKVFDKVFGKQHLSLKCFVRSAVISFAFASSIFLVKPPLPSVPLAYVLWPMAGVIVISNLLPDYISLLETRVVLRVMCRNNNAFWWMCLILFDAFVTLYIAVAGTQAAMLTCSFRDPAVDSAFMAWFLSKVLTFQYFGPIQFVRGSLGFANTSPYFIYPAFLTPIWLWLYAGSGFVLKAARRLDLGFVWFNRKFDIGKKPLSSMGLVAGSLVALSYWGVVAGAWIVQHMRH